MINLVELWKEAARQAGLERHRQRHRIGSGRATLYTIHRAARRGRNYGVGFCGGKQERERRARREIWT